MKSRDHRNAGRESLRRFYSLRHAGTTWRMTWQSQSDILTYLWAGKATGKKKSYTYRYLASFNANMFDKKLVPHCYYLTFSADVGETTAIFLS